MFDSNILYYAYDNKEGDDFGVGYLKNKEDWVHLLNMWNLSDGREDRYKTVDFEEYDVNDFRGCVLAEAVPDDQDYIVTWSENNKEYVVRVARNGELVWHNTINKLPSFPRWVFSLQKQLKSIKK